MACEESFNIWFRPTASSVDYKTYSGGAKTAGQTERLMRIER